MLADDSGWNTPEAPASTAINVFGFAHDPVLASPFIELNSDGQGWDDDLDSSVNETEISAHLEAISADWSALSSAQYKIRECVSGLQPRSRFFLKPQ